MISRLYLGLDLNPKRLAAVALRRHHLSAELVAGRTVALPEGVLAVSLRTPNILDRSRFVSSLQELLHPMAGSEQRVAVSLPDAVGRLLLTDIDTPFKTKREGEEILRWKLKGGLPNEGRNVQLDFQELGRREDGKVRVVVSSIVNDVLEQYEDVFQAAGYHAAVIDFHSLQLYNYYRPQLDLGNDVLLLTLEGGMLGLQYFEGQKLIFHRCREIEPDAGAVFRELNLSLTGALETAPGIRRATIFVHNDWPVREELIEALQALFEQEIVWLDPHFERICSSQLELPARQGYGLVAAIGAAERMM